MDELLSRFADTSVEIVDLPWVGSARGGQLAVLHWVVKFVKIAEQPSLSPARLHFVARNGTVIERGGFAAGQRDEDTGGQ